MATSLADGLLYVSVQAYKPAIVYINGAYYGIMNIREKVDDDFISRQLNDTSYICKEIKTFSEALIGKDKVEVTK